MPGTAELVLLLAPKMLKAYKKLAKDGKLHNDLVPVEDDLKAGLLRLVKDKFLTEDDLDKAANKPGDGWTEIIDLAANAVQKYAGLKKDGILAGRTIQWLLFAKRCHGKLNSDRTGIGEADVNARFARPKFVITSSPNCSRQLLASTWQRT